MHLVIHLNHNNDDMYSTISRFIQLFVIVFIHLFLSRTLIINQKGELIA